MKPVARLRLTHATDVDLEPVPDGLGASASAWLGAGRRPQSGRGNVIDPGSAPGTGTPEPGGMYPRELLRAVRRLVSEARLAGMDIVEVSPPYDRAEVTAAVAHRVAMEALSALVVRKCDGHALRFVASD